MPSRRRMFLAFQVLSWMTIMSHAVSTALSKEDNSEELVYICDDEWLFENRYRGFGSSVDMDEEFLAVGSCRDTIDDKFRTGSVSILKRNTNSFKFLYKVTASDQKSNDGFGYAVRISNKVLIVSSLHHSVQYTEQGAVYVFRINASIWTLEQKLLPEDALPYQRFGRALSVSGDRIVIGANHDNALGDMSGAVYIFSYNGSEWKQLIKLFPSDGAANDRFGLSVASYGNLIAVGAPWHNTDQVDQSGCVYVFERNDSDIWIQTDKLHASKPVVYGHFGYSISMYDNRMVVGGYDVHRENSSVYVFFRNSGSWRSQSVLSSLDGQKYDGFGLSVSIYQDTLVVGAPFSDNGHSNSGCSYAFVYASGEWEQRGKSVARDGGENFWFGYAVVVNKGMVAVGSPNDNRRNGSVYIFSLSYNPWKPTSNPDVIVKPTSGSDSISSKKSVFVLISIFIIFYNR